MELEHLLTIPMFLLCLIIWFAVFLQRRVIELLFPKIKTQPIWRDLFLPIGPAGTGIVFGFLVTNYPYPDALASTLWGRIGCSLFCGMFSGLVYRVVVKFFAGKLGKPEDMPTLLDDETLPK